MIQEVVHYPAYCTDEILYSKLNECIRALNAMEAANTSDNNARDEILLCTKYKPRFGDGNLVCPKARGKCTKQRKLSPIA